MLIDVALVPGQARRRDPGVLIVIDEIRASTTVTTLLDLGCKEVLLAGSVAAARRLARATGSLLAGERHAVKPAGFDFDNSPTRLVGDEIRGRTVIICTTNGTTVLGRLRGSRHVLVGCIRNARACADAAVRLADRDGLTITVVCAGQAGRFVIDDTVAAGVIVGRLVEAVVARGGTPQPTDAATAAVRLRASYPDLVTALHESDGGRTLHRIGHDDDVAFCADEDASPTVPILHDGSPMRIVRLER